MTNRKFWMHMREHWLGMIAGIEDILKITPTTAELREQWRRAEHQRKRELDNSGKA